jgi:hypothetical protein
MQNMVYNTTQYPHPPPPSHTLSVYVYVYGRGRGGGGQREGRGATVHKRVEITNITTISPAYKLY